MSFPSIKARFKTVDAQRRALEVAVASSLADPRPSVDHAIVREGLLADAARAARKIALNEALAASEVFLRRLEGRYPVHHAILFGSRARGDHNAESDADLAIILDGPTGARSTVAADMAGVAFHAMLETGVLVDPLPLWRCLGVGTGTPVTLFRKPISATSLASRSSKATVTSTPF